MRRSCSELPRSGAGRATWTIDFNQAADSFEPAIDLAVPAELRRSSRNGGSELQHDPARYEVAFGKAETGELEIRAETLWLIDSVRAAAGHLAVKESRVQYDLFPAEPPAPASLIHAGKTPPGWETVARKAPHSGNDYFKAEGGSGTSCTASAHGTALSGLPDDIDRFPIAIWVRNLLLDGVRALALNSAAMRRPVSPSPARRFNVEGPTSRWWYKTWNGITPRPIRSGWRTCRRSCQI